MITSDTSKNKFKTLALWLFVYSLLVILWGAWVRISHSGNGCGDTWPLCHGQLIPEAQRGKTWVEYAHRLMSGLYGFIVIAFYIYARKVYEKNSLTRKAALFTLIFMITEALLGAKLVLFKLVTDNDTPLRAFVMGLHQVNSLMLTGAIALCYASADASGILKASVTSSSRPQLKKWFLTFIKSSAFFPTLFILIATTGAWAALSTTLFPSQNLLAGLFEDLSAQSHYLVRLRLLHPLLALSIGSSICWYVWSSSQESPYPDLQRAGSHLALVLLIGLGFGVSTLLALSPVWMKLGHLALAQTIWFFLIRYLYIRKQAHEVKI